MRILHLLSDNSLMGGIVRHVVNVSTEQIREHDTVVAVCTVFPRNELHELLERGGVKAYALDTRRHNDICVVWRFARVMREFRPDIVHIHVLMFWQWLYLSFFCRKVKIVMTVHSSYGRDGILKRALKVIMPLRLAQRYFISAAVKRLYNSFGEEGIVVYNPLPNLVLNQRSRLRTLCGLSDTVRLIGTACRIGNVKRPECFTEAMARVLRDMDDVHAVIIGDGSDDWIPRLKGIAQKFGVLERFHFVGYREDAQVLISGLNVFVMSSEREGMPTAFLEAIGAGVPVAFMNGNGGLQDLVAINNGNDGPIGVDVNAGDVNALVGAIERLLADDDFHATCAGNGVRVCEKWFSVKRISHQLVESYRDIIGER